MTNLVKNRQNVQRFKSDFACDVTHDIGDQWRNVKSGINQDTLQNALQSKVILPVFSL